MKKNLKRLVCILLICCSFGMTGCIGSTGGGSSNISPPSDDLSSTVGNSQDIINTKDNITYYYESLDDLNKDIGKDALDRNNLKHTFGDAYVFVDPGEGCEMIDHYLALDGKTTEPVEFYRLVGRQIELLADILYTAINKIYLDGKIHIEDATDEEKYGAIDNQYVFGNNDSSWNVSELNFLSDKLNILPISDDNQIIEYPNYSTKIDLSQIYSYTVFSNIVGIPGADWTVDITVGENTTYENQQFFNLSYGVLGGYKVKVDSENSPPLYVRFYNQKDLDDIESGDMDACLNYNVEHSWIVTSGAVNNEKDTSRVVPIIQNNIKTALKSVIASALSGIEANLDKGYGDVASNYGEMLKAIDHLGFTTTDKLNIKTQILDNIIGQQVVNKDDEYLQLLKEKGIVDSNSQIEANQLKSYFYNDGDQIKNDVEHELFNYKGYRVVIDAIVEQAMNASISMGETETLFPELPRAKIIKMDSWNLMDQQEEETEEDEELEDGEEINPDDIETDPETIQFKEKFGEFYKIVGILFVPKKVVGERTMAIKEDDEWVKDEDGNVKLKTFNVEGFILTGSDLVLLSEEEKMTTYKVDYEVHTEIKNYRVSSDISEAGYVKPDPSEQATYNSTTTLDIDKQEIIEKEESEISEYRIKGYDGFSIVSKNNKGVGVVDEAVLINSEQEDQEMLYLQITANADNTSTIEYSTAMYKYIGVSDVNGDAGTTFAGYILDVSNFAGANYVVVNMPILAVNEDEQNRDAKFNILYFYMDCI